MSIDINFIQFLTQGVALIGWIVVAAAMYALVEPYIPGQPQSTSEEKQ
jgi:hypothetical protein